MNIKEYLIVIFMSVLFGCSPPEKSFREELFDGADLVVRCSASLTNNGARGYVRYKPMEVCKGVIEQSMLDEHGFLKYTSDAESDEEDPADYVLYVNIFKGGPTNTAFGSSFEIHVLLDV